MGLGEVKDGWPAPLLRVLRVLSLCPATRSGDSPPACWEGLGWRGSCRTETRPPTPTPTPALRADPPHKGRVKTEFAARGDRTSPGYTSIHIFSSRSPHTILVSHWSSDVSSSD